MNAFSEIKKTFQKSFQNLEKRLDKHENIVYNRKAVAGVAELADAHVWGACGFTVRVQFPSPAPKKDCNFDTKLQSFLTKSAFSGINPLRGWNRYAMKSALRQVKYGGFDFIWSRRRKISSEFTRISSCKAGFH